MVKRRGGKTVDFAIDDRVFQTEEPPSKKPLVKQSCKVDDRSPNMVLCQAPDKRGDPCVSALSLLLTPAPLEINIAQPHLTEVNTNMIWYTKG